MFTGRPWRLATFDKPFEMNGDTYRISEKQRLKFTPSAGRGTGSRKDLPPSNKRLPRPHERGWRTQPDRNLAPNVEDAENPVFYMCIHCLRHGTPLQEYKECCPSSFAINQIDSLVAPTPYDAKLCAARILRYAECRVEVNRDTQRITAKEKKDRGYIFSIDLNPVTCMDMCYLGELRYLRALRDVNEITQEFRPSGLQTASHLD